MSRPLRISYNGAWYHVINRGRRKERIFFCNKDYEDYLQLLQESKKLYELEVHAYSLMPNHYHLLIRTPQGNISRIMRHIDGVYTQRINKRHIYDGSLFRGRYKSIIIGGENYLKKLLQYIHMNPVKAGISKKPEDHRWTSHRVYLGQDQREWMETGFLISQFGKRRKEAISTLDNYVKRNEDNELSELLDKTRWPAILGGESFKEKLRDYISVDKVDKVEMWQYRELEKSTTIEDILSIFARKCNIEKDKIYATNRGDLGLGRRAFIYLVRCYTGKTCRELAAELGNVGYKTISWQYKTAMSEIKRRKGCWHIVKEIEKCL